MPHYPSFFFFFFLRSEDSAVERLQFFFFSFRVAGRPWRRSHDSVLSFFFLCQGRSLPLFFPSSTRRQAMKEFCRGALSPSFREKGAAQNPIFFSPLAVLADHGRQNVGTPPSFLFSPLSGRQDMALIPQCSLSSSPVHRLRESTTRGGGVRRAFFFW